MPIIVLIDDFLLHANLVIALSDFLISSSGDFLLSFLYVKDTDRNTDKYCTIIEVIILVMLRVGLGRLYILEIR
jgi:hypothetical protein